MNKSNFDKNSVPQKNAGTEITFKKTLLLSLEMGFMIVLPLLIFVGIGKFLDHKYGHQKLFVILGIVLALIMSTLWMYKKISEIIKGFENKE